MLRASFCIVNTFMKFEVITMREYIIYNCYNLYDYVHKSLVKEYFAPSNNGIDLCSVVGISTLALILCILVGIYFAKYHVKCVLNQSQSVFHLLKRSATLCKIDLRTYLRTILLITLVLCIPILMILLLLALIYKMLCSVSIKNNDKRFVEFLNSFDVIWSLDDSATINVIGIIEANSAEIIIDGLKEKLLTMPTKDGTEKVFYRRNEEYGFYYWRKYSFVDIDQYIQMIEVPNKHQLDKEDLENIMSEVCNQSLPYGNEGLFKIFVTKQRVGKSDSKRGEYGLIMRIHHSLGDGVALIKFLCQNLANSGDGSSVSMYSMPKIKNYNSPKVLVDIIEKLCKIPLCVVDMILRKRDVNALHGPTLLGLKVVKWTQSDENLLKLVKEIKEHVDNLSFSAVLMAALANGLHNFFMKTKNYVPEEVAVILPVRIPATANNNSKILQNNFSVTIYDVELRSRHLENSCRAFNKHIGGADSLTNHYFIKFAAIFPKQILQLLLSKSYATMVFSNMPGPDLVTICKDSALKSMVFFLPHSGNTGLGVTALTYGGVLRLAAMADKSLLSDTGHLNYILEGMVEEIKRLHQLYVK